MKEQLGKSFAAPFDPKKTGDRAAAVAAAVARAHQDEAGPRGRSRRRRAAGRRPGRHRLRPRRQALGRGDGRLPDRQERASSSPAAASSSSKTRTATAASTRPRVFLDDLPFPTGVLPWRRACSSAPRRTSSTPRTPTATARPTRSRSSIQRLRHRELPGPREQPAVRPRRLGVRLVRPVRRHHHVPQDRQDGRARRPRLPHQAGHRRDSNPRPARTQQGRVRDDWGNWFGCDNSNLVRHYALADHYLRRNPHVAYPNAVGERPARRTASSR